MPKTIEIRPLARDDKRNDFSCGQADIDRYFQHYAGQNQFKLHLAVNYVAVANRSILGFATISASSIERLNVPSKRMQIRLPDYPLPVLRLARLGVDIKTQGQGIGKALLRHVLGLAFKQRDQVGCIGVLVDAKPEAVNFYESMGFIPVEGVVEGLLHGQPLPMFLPMGTLAQSVP